MFSTIPSRHDGLYQRLTGADTDVAELSELNQNLSELTSCLASALMSRV